MRTNVDIDELVIREAMTLSGIKTKREIIDLALREYVAQRKRKDMRELRGQIQFSEGYDYKALREGR